MSFIDENDRNDKRSKAPWRDPENPVSEQDLQDWQNRQREQRRQRLPEEEALSELARKMQPEMEAAGFSNPFSYVAHLNARGGSHPRQGEMDAKFKREIVSGAAADREISGDARNGNGPSIQHGHGPMAQLHSQSPFEVQSTVVGDDSRGKRGTAPTTEPPELYGRPKGSRRVSPLSAEERKGLIDRVLEREGGFSSNQADPGNRQGTATKFGIRQRTLDIYRAKNPNRALPAMTKDLTADDARRIYDEEYIQAYRVDEIRNAELREYVFDMMVNHGYDNAVEMLQQTLVATTKRQMRIDKILGSATLDTINNLSRDDADRLRLQLSNRRAEFIKGLKAMRDGVRNRWGRMMPWFEPHD